MEPIRFKMELRVNLILSLIYAGIDYSINYYIIIQKR